MKNVMIAGLVLLLVTGTAVAQNSNANPRALDASLKHFNANARAYGLTNPSAELKARNSSDDQYGFTHVRFDQSYNGVRVFEGEAITHIAPNGRLTVTNSIRGNINVDTTPSIAPTTAVDKVMKALALRGEYSLPTAELQIVAKGDDTPVDRLVWHVTAPIDNLVDETAQWEYFIDAHSGQEVFHYNGLQTTSSTTNGSSMYSGTVALNTDTVSGTIFMRDVVRSAGNVTNNMFNGTSGSGTTLSTTGTSFGNGSTAKPGQSGYDANTAGVDAAYGLQLTWDYYKTNHGRNGIDGAGTKTYSRVHYSANYDNAFWSDSCFCMTYGDGSSFKPLVSIDVAAHEMSHGVMSRSANLTYRGESGGLNEANSDIFGTLVEFSAGNNNDAGDYLIGEKLSTKPLRYQTQPSLDGRSPNCWSSTIKRLDVHYSSGPMNHAFFLATNGDGSGSNVSKCNSKSVPSMSRADFSKVWYLAITKYMTSSTNYAGARQAALSAAAAAFGTGSAQYNTIAAAFSGINVN